MAVQILVDSQVGLRAGLLEQLQHQQTKVRPRVALIQNGILDVPLNDYLQTRYSTSGQCKIFLSQAKNG